MIKKITQQNYPLFTGNVVRNYFFVIILAIFILNDLRLALYSYEEDSPPIFIVIIIYFATALTTVALLLNKTKQIRNLSQVLLYSCFFTDLVFLILGNFPFSYADAINLFNNPDYASGTISTFASAFLLAFAGTCLMFLISRFSVQGLKVSFPSYWILIFAGLHSVIFFYAHIHPSIYDFLPSVFRVTGNSLSAGFSNPEKHWRRKNITVRAGHKKARHIFLIVDESVAGTVLSLNGFPFATTPFLESAANEIINYGSVSSFTNFSSGSNLSIAVGMRQTELPDKKYLAFMKPSIFQYAQKSGYKTYLLDGQTTEGKLQNYNTKNDLIYIDSLYQPATFQDSIPSSIRDLLLAEKIISISESDQPSFVYVNKAGAHWPYNSNFPSDSLTNHFLNSESRKNAVNYYKSIYWNVDRFWKKLMSDMHDQKDFVIIYTSDHGENFSSPSFKIKHASIYKTDSVEGLVPLILWDKADFVPEKFAPICNTYSQQYIFPTLLLIMGYNQSFINTNYGKTLIEKPELSPVWFQTGDLFGRGANKRIYIRQ